MGLRLVLWPLLRSLCAILDGLEVSWKPLKARYVQYLNSDGCFDGGLNKCHSSSEFRRAIRTPRKSTDWSVGCTTVEN